MSRQRSNATNHQEQRYQRLLCEHLRRLRQRNEMTQTDVAAELGITYQQWQKYERGTNRISATKLALFADLFDVTLDEFFIERCHDDETD